MPLAQLICTLSEALFAAKGMRICYLESKRAKAAPAFERKDKMLVPVVAGIVAGIVGFLPLFISLRLSRRSASLSAMGTGLYGLAGTFVSLIIVAVALIVCAVTNREVVLPFGVAEIVALIVSTSAYVVYKNVLAKRKNK